jgi:hypothetical protein
MVSGQAGAAILRLLPLASVVRTIQEDVAGQRIPAVPIAAAHAQQVAGSLQRIELPAERRTLSPQSRASCAAEHTTAPVPHSVIA